MRILNNKALMAAVSFLIAFVLWTLAICFIDVRAIGPNNSTVGLATINRFVHKATGVHMSLYVITDWLGLVPVGFMFGFAVFGLIQWIVRKNLFKVDFNILILGGFYVVVIAAYVFFEMFVVNYRPVLINGFLEASYPSSTTLLVLTVMPTAILQLNSCIKNSLFKIILSCVLIAFTVFMVIARLVSGVHWFTDIVGGVILSAGLVMMYYYVCSYRVNESA